MQAWRSVLIVTHRYLGILLALFFLLWFASGFVIVYTGGMPGMTEGQRLQHLPELDLAAVRLSPLDAQLNVRTDELPVLTTVMNRPAYRFETQSIVFADDGDVLSSSQVSSQQIAANFLGVDTNSLRRVGTIDEVDQWTIGLRGQLPLEKFIALDGQGSEVYISPTEAKVLLHTTSRDRLLAWLGAIPHWLYFVQLRKNSELWSQVVIWSSSLATLMAMVGLVLLGTQLRWTRLPRWREAIPYRGLMRWHYLAALMFGLFVISWAFSGLLSMEPYRWTRQSGLALDFDTYFDTSFDQTAPLSGFENFDGELLQRQLAQDYGVSAIKELQFGRFQGTHFLELTIADAQSSWQHRTLRLQAEPPFDALPLFAEEEIVRQLESATGAEVLLVDELDNYDAYYSGRQSAESPSPPLPVLRVQFDDEVRSVFYIDLNSAQPVFRTHRWSRLERWLYRGLHSLDFGAFYRSRPLWDIVVLLLLTGGLVVTVLGTILGFRRLRRSF